MFIHLEGRSKDEAFQIGQEIVDAVTAMFPKPIKLKFEKVSASLSLKYFSNLHMDYFYRGWNIFYTW